MKKAHIAAARRFNGSPQAREMQKVENGKLEWRGKCRKCGKVLKGRPAELVEHTCGE